jgi:hypothetical protein
MRGSRSDSSAFEVEWGQTVIIPLGQRQQAECGRLTPMRDSDNPGHPLS